MENIIFFYPSKVVGGAEFLFARLADYISKNISKNVYYIDYKDGFIRNNKCFENLNYIDFSDNSKVNLDFDGVLITPISNVHRIDDFINFKNKNIKLMFWTLHACNLIHVMPEGGFLEYFGAAQNKILLELFFKNSYNVFSNLLRECDKLNSLCHMDYMTFSYNKKIFPELKTNYLPIASIDKEHACSGKIINDGEINIAILGRLCVEKTMPLLNVLKCFNELNVDEKINVYIIGEGECRKLIEPKKYKNINIVFKGTIVGEALDKFLTENTDVLFSVGTSCLEGAALKMPVIVLPGSYSKFSFDKFYFFYESKFYNVANWLDDYKKIAHLTVKDIIALIYKDNKKAEIGLRNYEYFCKNHSLENVSAKLIECIENNLLTYYDYAKIKERLPKLRKNRNLIYKLAKGIVKYAKR